MPAGTGPAGNSLRQGIFSFRHRILSAFSIHNRDLAGCPAGFPGPGTGKSAELSSDFPVANRELPQCIAAPFRVSMMAQHTMRLRQF
jgi:hypothetical protein